MEMTSKEEKQKTGRRFYESELIIKKSRGGEE
jgi:hypothetical protein